MTKKKVDQGPDSLKKEPTNFDYSVKYGNNTTETINAPDLLAAQKIAHKKAAAKKTILIYCKLNNL